jgi:D-alanyl-D-alanine carboxypeptidase
MNTNELIELAANNRISREAAVALLVAVAVLGIFIFIPGKPKAEQAPVSVSVASTTPDAYLNLPIQGKAAIVYDLVTHQTLFAKNADAQLPLASLTKLLTVYAAVHELGLNTNITMEPSALAVDGPNGLSGLKSGESFTLKNLASFTLTASVNAGATELAEATAQKESKSPEDTLTAAAEAAGLSETYALNGSGLDVSTTVSGGYGSARDVAILAGALLTEAPTIAEATTHASVTISSSAGKAHTLPNTNQGVIHTPSILLSKTGYTDLAGGNLVVVFDAGIAHPVAVAILGSTQDARFSDVDTLVAATLAHFAGTKAL